MPSTRNINNLFCDIWGDSCEAKAQGKERGKSLVRNKYTSCFWTKEKCLFILILRAITVLMHCYSSFSLGSFFSHNIAATSRITYAAIQSFRPNIEYVCRCAWRHLSSSCLCSVERDVCRTFPFLSSIRRFRSLISAASHVHSGSGELRGKAEKSFPRLTGLTATKIYKVKTELLLIYNTPCYDTTESSPQTREYNSYVTVCKSQLSSYRWEFLNTH